MEDFGVKEKNMERTRKRFGVLTLSMILAILVSMMLPALAAAQPDPRTEPQPPARLTIKSVATGTNNVGQGGEVLIIAEGFFEFEPIDFVVTTPEGRVFQFARRTTNTAGETAFTMRFGPGDPVGTFTVTAVGVVSGLRATGQISLAGGATPGVQGLARISAVFVFRRATAPGSTTGTTSMQGRFLLIEGTNFFPNERISCFATFQNGTVRQLFENEVTSAGEFSETLSPQFTATLPLGTLAITCFGITSTRSAITRVEVTGADFLAPIVRGTVGVEVSPTEITRSNAAAARSQIVVRAEGFRPGERVSFFFTEPNGTVNPANTREVRANDAGEAAITIGFTSFALTGRYAVTAFGQTSLFRGIANFTVLP